MKSRLLQLISSGDTNLVIPSDLIKSDSTTTDAADRETIVTKAISVFNNTAARIEQRLCLSLCEDKATFVL